MIHRCLLNGLRVLLGVIFGDPFIYTTLSSVFCSGTSQAGFLKNLLQKNKIVLTDVALKMIIKT